MGGGGGLNHVKGFFDPPTIHILCFFVNGQEFLKAFLRLNFKTLNMLTNLQNSTNLPLSSVNAV
jgi:hypothetical protein